MKALILTIGILLSTVFAFAATNAVQTLQNGPKQSSVATWSGVTSGTAAATRLKVANYVDHVVQVEGTFSSGTVLLQGSNDGTTFYTLADQLGSGASFTAAGLKKLEQAPLYIKPVVTGGTSATAVNVILHSK